MSKVSRERGEKITATLVFTLDQTLKFLFHTKNIIREQIPLIKGLLYIVPSSQNPGIAFGLFKDYSRFFVIPAFLVVLFIFLLYLYTSKKHTIIRWGLLLILAGATSNLVDRIIYGSVIDYIFLEKFPYSFNLADPAILTGVGLIIINIIKNKKKKTC
jgi:signal peptidase II